MLLNRLRDTRIKELHSFAFAGLSYAWIATLLHLIENIRLAHLISVSTIDVRNTQALYIGLTFALLVYARYLFKRKTYRNLMIAFFAAIFFAVWNPAHVLLSIIALALMYVPKRIFHITIPDFLQPLLSLVCIIVIYMDAISRAVMEGVTGATLVLQLLSLAVLVDVAVVHAWIKKTGRL